jgi:hypothetical protein
MFSWHPSVFTSRTMKRFETICRTVAYVELLQRVQAGGKAVQVWGTADELKHMRRLLRPEKTMFCASLNSQAEADVAEAAKSADSYRILFASRRVLTISSAMASGTVS